MSTSAPPAAGSSKGSRSLFIVFFTVFLDLIGFGIIIPIQPFYAQAFGAEPATITLLGAAYSLMQFLFAPVWGRLSDRIGRRPVMLVSIAASVLGFALFGLATSLWMLFLSRAIAGFGNANIGTAQAIIADSTTPENRARGMGLIGAAFGLGFICGPALGGFFGEYGLAVPAFVAAGLSALNWLLTLFLLPETHPAHRKDRAPGAVHAPSAHAGHARFGISWAALKRVARHADVTKILIVYMLFSMAFSLMEQVLGLYIERVWVTPSASAAVADAEAHMKAAARLTTYVLIVVGVMATLVQGMLIGRLAKAFGERRLLISGIFFAALGLFLVPVVALTEIYALMLVVAAVLALGTGLTNPSLSSLLSRAVDPMEQGTVLGIGQSLAALGRVIGPSMSGILFQLAAPAPFFLGGGLMLLCALAASTVRARKPAPHAPPDAA